jgi:archaellin
MTQEKIQQDKYVQDYTYYVNQNGNLEKIKLNKSTILKLVKDKQSIVKEYAKINNLDFSNEIDVNIILKYYESL